MSSTNKTSNLGLNSWLESDKPKRTDFIYDNNIIDNVLGGHISDESIHLTSEEKSRVQEPFSVKTVYGTGDSSVQVKPGFVPSMVIVYKLNSPLCQTEDSYTKVNAGVATSLGTSGGVTISDNVVTLQQDSTAQDGIFYNLNEQYSQYIAVMFR